MPGNRIGRINEEIQRELSAQIRRLKDPRVNAVGMVSVTRTDVTRDLRYCTVYISALDKTKEKDALKGLKSAAGFLRRELGQQLRLRYTPELLFQADDSILRGANVLEILRNVEYAPEESEIGAEESSDDTKEPSDDTDEPAENTEPENNAETVGNAETTESEETEN